jgi:maltooligosyltrehalose trehalohydrolase
MGQEFAASSSFLYFTDHNPELGRLVTEGRRAEFGGFAAFADPVVRESIPDPQSPETFRRSKPNPAERALHAPVYELYRELLRLRREDTVLRHGDRRAMRAEAIGAQMLLVHRWHGDEHRLLVVNFGPSVGIRSATLPALGDLSHSTWEPILATSEPRYGGNGAPCGFLETPDGPRFEIPARTAVVFFSHRRCSLTG